MQIELGIFYSRLGTIAIILALGFLLGKLKLITAKTNKELVNLLLTVFMPASLFVAFPSAYNEETSGMFLWGVASGFVVMFTVIIVSKIIFNKKFYKKEKQRSAAQFALVFNNATFLGYPIISSTFGEQGVIPYCGFIIVFNVALFSYGVYLFRHKVDAKLLFSVITNPNIIAVVLGLIVFLASFQLPAFVKDAAQFTSNATTALSIICVGYMLSNAKLSRLIRKWKLIITAFSQLFIGPMAAWGMLTLFHFPFEVVVVCTLIQALPTATSLGLFASKYGGDETEASELVTISTFASIIMLPLMTSLLLIH